MLTYVSYVKVLILITDSKKESWSWENKEMSGWMNEREREVANANANASWDWD